MTNISRKDFFKKACYSGACLCGFSYIGLSNNDLASLGFNNESQNNNKDLCREWLSILLSNINNELDENEKRNILKKCASVHYDHLDMNSLLAPYRYDLNKFIDFLEEEWNWKIDYNRTTKTLIADENKNHCVCPIINNNQKSNLSSICYCSEGFAELMFSYIVGEPVSATVISSILRGDERCIYRITF